MSWLVYVYNCTKNDAARFSPHFLLFGRDARLSVDLCFNITFHDENESRHLQFGEKLRQDLKKKPASLQQKQITELARINAFEDRHWWREKMSLKSSKTLHRDHLVPIGYLVRIPDVQYKTKKNVY